MTCSDCQLMLLCMSGGARIITIAKCSQCLKYFYTAVDRNPIRSDVRVTVRSVPPFCKNIGIAVSSTQVTCSVCAK